MDVFVTFSCSIDHFGTHVIRSYISQGFMKTIVLRYGSESEEYEAWDTWYSIDREGLVICMHMMMGLVVRMNLGYIGCETVCEREY